MKLFMVLATFTLLQAATVDRNYLPPKAETSAGSDFLESPRESNGFKDQTGAYSSNAYFKRNEYTKNVAFSGFVARPERAQAVFERNAGILRQDNSNDGETYAYGYETENGIYAEESGVATNGVQAQGGYSYTGDDGKVYSVRYTADENGFQPQGDHLPTPPPVPEEILRALERNALDEAAGIYDDGTYSKGKYDSNNQKQYYNNNAESNNYKNADSVVSNNAFIRNDAAGGGSSVAELLKAYLPSYDQKDAAGSRNSIAGIQKAYLPPFNQHNNQKNEVTNFNNALARNDAISSELQNAYVPAVGQHKDAASNAGIQKAYLPSFTQHNNLRSRVSLDNSNDIGFDRNGADDGGDSVADHQNEYLLPSGRHNDGVRSRNSIDEVQEAYLPPLTQHYNGRSGVGLATFNKDDFDSPDAVGLQKAYLPPFSQQNDAAGSGSYIARIQKAYLPPYDQRHKRSTVTHSR